ncbi:copper resistance protein CopD [Helicobacter vulpis]|uniref:copper resistance protein CopD n=1 Tax=Helicobacter vulpis TaxID=2316076 RepID=UPI000EB17E0F|nr:copper resistance protein CopD [Helicobacter vulpis]
METLYPYALLVHLCCAIIFLGYLFFDVAILSRALKRFTPELASKIEQAIGSRAIKIMPICVLLLLLTGGVMLSNYVGGEKGWLETPFQRLLLCKVALACVIFALVIFSLACKFLNKSNPLAPIIHPFVLILGVGIVICAKWMWFI